MLDIGNICVVAKTIMWTSICRCFRAGEYLVICGYCGYCKYWILWILWTSIYANVSALVNIWWSESSYGSWSLFQLLFSISSSSLLVGHHLLFLSSLLYGYHNHYHHHHKHHHHQQQQRQIIWLQGYQPLNEAKIPNEDFSVQNGYRVNVPNKNGLISLGLTADWTKQLEMIVNIGNSIRPTNQV